MDVSTASMRVGYLSISQFNREYRRFFGNSPSKDIERLRRHLASGGTHFSVEGYVTANRLHKRAASLPCMSK